jgi:natural product precursor
VKRENSSQGKPVVKRENPKLRKLNLNRESLRRLSEGELRPAIGGYVASYPISTCETQC